MISAGGGLVIFASRTGSHLQSDMSVSKSGVTAMGTRDASASTNIIAKTTTN